MEAQKYVELALSKDITRLNLNHVYRAENALVATDGHRLHKRNSLTSVTPHYPDGFDGEFPDYKQVEPRRDAVTTIKLDCSDTRTLKIQLKALCAIAALAGKDKLGEFTAETTNPGLAITVTAGSMKASLHLLAEILHKDSTPMRVGLNLQYVIDALAPAFDRKYGETVLIKLFDTPTSNRPYSLGPVTVQFESAEHEHFSALPMPVRLP